MDFMPAVAAKFEAFFDEEEIYTSNAETVVSDWAPRRSLSTWMRQSHPASVRPLDVVKLWEDQQDVIFQQAVIRALEQLEMRTVIVSYDEAIAPHNETGEVSDAEVSTTPEEESQLALSLSMNFVPSVELIDVWRDNISHFVDGQAIARAKVAQASAEFSKMFRKMMGAFAQEKRHVGGGGVFVIANVGGDFDTAFQLDISERFLLVPQKSTSFFELLYRDLIGCDEKIFTASWGAFVRKPDNTLILELLPPNRINRDGFVKARELRR
jgi:hypothetical protein